MALNRSLIMHTNETTSTKGYNIYIDTYTYVRVLYIQLIKFLSSNKVSNVLHDCRSIRSKVINKLKIGEIQ